MTEAHSQKLPYADRDEPAAYAAAGDGRSVGAGIYPNWAWSVAGESQMLYNRGLL